MKRYIKSIMTAGLLSLSLVNTSCIEETEPTSNVVTTNQMAKSSGVADALVSAIPAALNVNWSGGNSGWDYGYAAIMHIRDIMTEDAITTDGDYDWWFQWEQTYYIGPDYLVTQFVWNSYYNYVLTTNNLIDAINPETATETQLGYLGVGYACRAMYYLDMARMYEFLPNKVYPDNKNEEGNVVLNLTCPIVKVGMTEEEARVNPRATREEMATFIEEDLTEAEKYIGYLSDRRNNILPDLACVYGLKARLYMWLEDYPKAKEYARKAIETTNVTPITKEKALNPATGYNDASDFMWASTQNADTETVQMKSRNWTGWNCNETDWGYAGRYAAYFMIGKSVYDRIDDADWRKLQWKAPEGSALENLVPFLDTKYKNKLAEYSSIKFRPNAGNNTDYLIGAASAYPLMRVEEMYLIEAEAAAHSSDSEGQQLINNFMKSRNPNYNTSLTGKQLIDEIVLQKRIELWGEGQTFFDVKRLDMSVTRGYEGTNFFPACRFNTDGRPSWMNFCIVRNEENNNEGVKGYNNPDPSDNYSPWTGN